MYNVNNFLDSYSSTSRTVRILHPNGKVSFTLMVCNYQKSSVSGNTLNIVLEDNTKEYKLSFNSSSEAKSALSLLKQAIDILKPNCIVGGGGNSSSNEQTELLSVLSTNILSNLTFNIAPATVTKTVLSVNGKLEDCLGDTPAFTASGNSINWLSSNSGYDLITDDRVIVKYFT